MTMAASGSRIGLLGGTFNPIHLGHLRAAEEVRETLDLERVLFIPSNVPPHKQSAEHDPIASAAERLDWVERAIASHKAFSIDRIELDRAGPSYLVDTLEAIRDRESGSHRTVFIVGEDAFAEMGDWYQPERIFASTDLAVMTRPPGAMRDLTERMPAVVRDVYDFAEGGRRARHQQSGTSIELVPITALDISSSQVRACCRSGRSIRFLVPESIRTSIESSGAYGPNRRDP